MASMGTGRGVSGTVQPEAAIAAALRATLSPDEQARRHAEDVMARLAETPGFSLALLQLTESPSAQPHERQAAAVYLKNYVGRLYDKDDWRSRAVADRAALKETVVHVMLRVPVLVRRQLSEMLAIIADHEYPTDWPNLVPELGTKLLSMVSGSVPDWLVMQGIVEALQAVFERYPWRPRSDPLYTEINYSLSNSQEPVLAAIKYVCNVMHDTTGFGSINADKQRLIIGNAEALCKVFFCLSWQELPPYFEDNIAAFMTEFQRLLNYSNAAFDEDADEEPNCVEKLHVSVLETLNLYESKYDEEFRPFLQSFVQNTWQLLTRTSDSAKHDAVVTTGVKFLTTVARSPDYGLFSDPASLVQVCQQIVIPNIELRDDDIELFEDNPVEYVRRDMESSDADTRRRGAVELVKGLCVHFERPVTEAFASHVTQLLGAQSTWKQKDVALYIVTALGWKKGTAAGGVTETSSLVDVLDFFRVNVLPNLASFGASPTTLTAPIFAADCIKFVTSFRNQIPKSDYGTVIASCVKLLQAREAVVQTYAAACIERLLTVKDAVQAVTPINGSAQVSNGGSNGTMRQVRTPRITSQDVSPMLPKLLPAVVDALQRSPRGDEYLMRLLLRIIAVSKAEIRPYAGQILSVVARILGGVIQNPQNPLFSHYLFESISALIAIAGDDATVEMFEAQLIGHMQAILEQDLTEFGQYVFQIMSQLMALHRGGLPVTYSVMIPPLLVPAMWDRRGYVRGMVLYLESYIRKNSTAVVQDRQLEPILGVFNKLVASKATDHLGIQLLCTMLETYDAKTMAAYMNTIIRLLITRLHAAKTPKYVQNLLYCLSVIVLRYGSETLVVSLNALQQGLMAMLLSQVWIAELPSVMRQSDRRVCALAMADIACATDLCRAEPYLSLWPAMLTATIALLEGVQTDAGDEPSDDEENSIMEAGDHFAGARGRLKWATQATPSGSAAGVAPGVDARTHLAQRVASLSERHPGVFGPLLVRDVEEGARIALQSYLSRAGRTVA